MRIQAPRDLGVGEHWNAHKGFAGAKAIFTQWNS